MAISPFYAVADVFSVVNLSAVVPIANNGVKLRAIPSEGIYSYDQPSYYY